MAVMAVSVLVVALVMTLGMAKPPPSNMKLRKQQKLSAPCSSQGGGCEDQYCDNNGLVNNNDLVHNNSLVYNHQHYGNNRPHFGGNAGGRGFGSNADDGSRNGIDGGNEVSGDGGVAGL